MRSENVSSEQNRGNARFQSLQLNLVEISGTRSLSEPFFQGVDREHLNTGSHSVTLGIKRAPPARMIPYVS